MSLSSYSEEYWSGYNAYIDDCDDNPYYKGTSSWSFWDQGWRDAREDDHILKENEFLYGY